MFMYVLKKEKELEVVLGALIPMSYLCLSSLKKKIMFLLYEALKSSTQSGFQKFGILSKKGGKLWQNFLKLCAENSSHLY